MDFFIYLVLIIQKNKDYKKMLIEEEEKIYKSVISKIS